MDPVFTYHVSEIGETRDANRWELEQNDLTEAVALYNQFKGSPQSFASNRMDRNVLRCRTVPFNEFQRQPHWLVDRWWSHEERLSLGITDEPKVVTDEELRDIVIDLQETLTLAGNLPEPNVEEAKYRKISLSDSSLFTLSIGKRVLKKHLASEGIPVYSANVNSPFGYLPLGDLTGFAGPALLWGIDGTFDWGYIGDNEPFVPTDHCGVLYIEDDKIHPGYLYHELKVTRDAYDFDRTHRANLANIRRYVTVRVPVDREGNFDLEAQQRIAERYDTVRSVQEQLVEQLEAISGMQYEWEYLTEAVEPKD